MDTENMIEITGADLVEVVKKVYDLSKPQGLGFLHFNANPLSNEEAKEIIAIGSPRKNVVVDMDYVNGRACKFTVFKDDQDRKFIRSQWYDHSQADLDELLRHINK
jgi:hypothetical protein